MRRSGPPPADRARAWLAQVADALEHCHGLGLVHRDLKPHNVILERASGRVVLVDFGLVARDPAEFGRLSIDDYSRLSLSGEILGTPGFMAPEQVDPSFGPVGPRTDVYALGGLLYFLLCGRAPYVGKSPIEVFTRLLDSERPPPDPRPLAPQAPADLITLCRRCLERDPERRPDSAAACLEQLRAGGTRPPTTRRRGLWATAAALAALALWLFGWAPRPAPEGGAADPVVAPEPGPPRPVPHESFETLYEQGLAATEAGEPEAARALFERALKLRPPDAPGDAKRALAFGHAGLHEAGLAEAARAVEADAKDPEAWWIKGQLHLLLGQRHRAKADFTRVLELRPDHGQAWAARGGLHVEEARYVEANHDLWKAIKNRAGDYRVLTRLAHCCNATGDETGLERVLTTLLDTFPDRAREIELLRLELCLDRGELDLARGGLDRLLDEAPEHPSALRQRAALRLHDGDLDGAQRDLERYARATKRAANALELEGRYLLYRDRAAEADERFRRALERQRTTKGKQRVLLWRVMAQLVQDRIEEARDAAREAHEAAPDLPWGALWLAALGDPSLLAALRANDAQPHWVLALAEALRRGDRDATPAVLRDCPSRRERTIAFGLLGLRAETRGEPDAARDLYGSCLRQGATRTQPWEWAQLRLRGIGGR